MEGNETMCVLCGVINSDKVEKLREKGLQTLREISEIRKDEAVQQKLLDTNITYHVHGNCRKKYTRSRNELKSNSVSEIDPPKPVLRSQDKIFDFKQHCLFCAEVACKDLEKKKPSTRRRLVHMVEYMDLLDKIREQVDINKDDTSKAVETRVCSISCLIAEEARYHFDCYQLFMRDNKSKTSGRPKEDKKDEAFKLLCQYIEQNDESQNSMSELMEKMQEFDPSNLYTSPWITKKLRDHYGDELLIISLPGKPTVVIYRCSAYKTIHQNWHSEKKSDMQDERIRIVEAAVAIVQEDIKSTYYNRDSYKLVEDMEADTVKSIPHTLKLLVGGLIGENNKKKKKEDNRKSLAIASAIVAAARPRSYISPILLATGIWLHRKFASRNLLDMLSALGFCASYHEVQKFEISAVQHVDISVSREGFMQFVFDNADINTCSLTGKDTFHSLGGIKVITPSRAVSSVTSIPRLTVHPRSEILGKFGNIPIQIFHRSPTNHLNNITIQELPDIKYNPLILQNTLKLNTLYLSSALINAEPQPLYSGFMKTATKNNGPHEKSCILYLPFINLSPTDFTALHSALSYAESECYRQGQKVCMVTFDQQLYILAKEIEASSQELGKKIILIIRLGGFHLLMSFLGAVGFCMQGSGLEELWGTVYAAKTVPHMISGHAIARSIRAHIITGSALAITLLKDSPEMTSSNISELKSLHSDLLQNKMTPADVTAENVIQILHNALEREILTASTKSRTAKLWLQYFEQNELIRLFIQAERTGDWILHLRCIKEMLPFFNAAAHLNYAKSSHLYIQDVMHKISLLEKDDYKKLIEGGLYSIRRCDDFWAALSADYTIETTLMRAMKVTGGIAGGRGTTESVLATWVLSLPACIAYTEPLENFTRVVATTTDQHVELGNSRQARDIKDLTTFSSYLADHSPFSDRITELQSISTGLLADSTVNCDMAKSIGQKSMNTMIGKNFGNVKLKRSDRVKPLAVTNKSIKINDDVIIIESQQFFNRMICMTSDDTDLRACLCYELALNSPALFDESGLMRTATKSALKDSICRITGVQNSTNPMENTICVIDGGNLLHRVTWPKYLTYRDIMNIIVQHVIEIYGRDSTVVFDGYELQFNTKQEAHRSRYQQIKKKIILFEENMICDVSQSTFLASPENKTRLISKLTTKLQDTGVSVRQSTGDADVLIIETAIELASQNQKVIVVGNDTDLLVLLLARATSNENITMMYPNSKNESTNVFNIRNMQEKLATQNILSKCLLFMHAMTGCDTTSAIYRKGKKTVLKLLKQPEIQNIALTFHEKDAVTDDIIRGGERFLLEIYKSKESSLDAERYYAFHQITAGQKSSSKFELAALPPTSAAAKQHSLRVYHQVQHWLGNTLPPTDWGWQLTGTNTLRPIPTLEPPAPDHLLTILRCKCKTNCSGNCSCKRNGLKCSPMCGNCRGVECSNRDDRDFDITDSESDSEDRPVICSTSGGVRRKATALPDGATQESKRPDTQH